MERGDDCSGNKAYQGEYGARRPSSDLEECARGSATAELHADAENPGSGQDGKTEWSDGASDTRVEC